MHTIPTHCRTPQMRSATSQEPTPGYRKVNTISTRDLSTMILMVFFLAFLNWCPTKVLRIRARSSPWWPVRANHGQTRPGLLDERVPLQRLPDRVSG